MNLRQHALEEWLQTQCRFTDYMLMPLAGDASFRRYFRLTHNTQSYIVVDAPKEHENCVSFIAIAEALRQLNLVTPIIFASDLDQGFLVVSDLGDRLYLKELNTTNAASLYDVALEALCVLQTCASPASWTVPVFTRDWIRKELAWFEEWFLEKYLNLSQQATVLHPFFDWLADSLSKQPYVFAHRDYHSANLMVLDSQKKSTEAVGILDFQDAFFGPVTYDLASLLRDCYIDWPEAFVQEKAMDYLKKCQQKKLLLTVSPSEFLFWFDLASMQRHLKALMTFSRKLKRDHNDRYIQFIPRTLNYLMNVSQRYPESKVLTDFLKQEIDVCAP